MRTGYLYVVGDIIHIGHLKYLQNGKNLCDKLIVGVLTDEAVMEKKPRPIISYEERLETVKNIKCVDKAIQQDTYSPLPNVKILKPDILFESTSHTKEAIEEAKKVMKKLGGEVKVFSYHKLQSSTKIKKKVIYESSKTPKLLSIKSIVWRVMGVFILGAVTYFFTRSWFRISAGIGF